MMVCVCVCVRARTHASTFTKVQHLGPVLNSLLADGVKAVHRVLVSDKTSHERVSKWWIWVCGCVCVSLCQCGILMLIVQVTKALVLRSHPQRTEFIQQVCNIII